MSEISRRSILKGTSASLLSGTLRVMSASSLAFFAASAPAYSNNDRLKILLKLRKSISSLGTFFSWVSWAEDAVPLLAGNTPAPAPPGGVCDESLAAPLEKYVEDIRGIEPNYDLPDVSYEGFSETDLRINRRIINSNLTKIILVHAGEYELDAALLQIDIHRARLQKRWTALDRFSEELVELLSILPTASSYYVALSCFGAIQLTYSDIFDDALVALAQLKRKTTNAQLEYTNDMLRLVGEHQVFLSLERASHEEEQIFQQNLDSEILSVREILTEQNQLIDEQNSILEESNAFLLATKLDVRSYRDRIVDLGSSKRSLQEQIRNDRNRLQQRYSYCPNGNTYNNCGHTNEKSRWNRERTQASNRINQNSTRISGIDQQISFSNSKILQLNQAITDLQQKIVNIENMVSEAEMKAQELSAEIQMLETELVDRKFRNPLDFLTDAVAREQDQLDRLRNDLD